MGSSPFGECAGAPRAPHVLLALSLSRARRVLCVSCPGETRESSCEGQSAGADLTQLLQPPSIAEPSLAAATAGREDTHEYLTHGCRVRNAPLLGVHFLGGVFGMRLGLICPVSAGSAGGAPVWDHGLWKREGASPGAGTRGYAGRSGEGLRSPLSPDGARQARARDRGTWVQNKNYDVCPFSFVSASQKGLCELQGFAGADQRKKGSKGGRKEKGRCQGHLFIETRTYRWLRLVAAERWARLPGKV